MSEEEFLPLEEVFPGVISYKFPSDYFVRERAPKEAFRIADEIMRHPERFGSDKIRNAAAYLREYESKMGGMTQIQTTELRERKDRFEEVFKITLCKSVYDDKVFKGFGISLDGVVPTKDFNVDIPFVEHLYSRDDFYLRSPIIWVQPERTVSFNRGLFDSYWLKFGIHMDNCSTKRDLALGRHFGFANPNIRDTLMWKAEPYLRSKKVFGGLIKNGTYTLDFTEDADPEIARVNAENANRFRKYPDERILSYLCVAKYDGKNLSLLNKGLDPMPIFIRSED